MSESRQFRLRAEHIALLRRAVVRWEDCEYGAPAIDCKRPYGNSSVEYDIAEILGWAYDDDAGLSDAQRERASELHAETETALQVILCTGSFTLGIYVNDHDFRRDWKLFAADSGASTPTGEA